MEIAVLLQPVHGNGYRASVGEPFQISAEGPTRDEALTALRALLEERARQGAEIVTMQFPVPARRLPTTPVWPNDELTKQWLEGIAEYRRQRNEEPDPWDLPMESAK